MEDKDLDRYFKDRSDSLNEAPGEGLWAKIEANIEPPAQGGFKAGKWLLPGAGVVVVAGLVATWLAKHNTADVPASDPQHPQETVIITDAVVPVADTLLLPAKDTITPITTTPEIQPAQNHPTPKGPAIANADAAPVEEFYDDKQGEDTKPAVAAGPVPLYTYNVKSTGDTIATPGKKSIPYNFDFDENRDAMEITITQKITSTERNSLIQNTIKGNAPYVGRKIVIKAKGYRIYRHTITQADYNKFGLQDTLSPKLNLKVVTDTVFYDLMQDSLTPETIKFKTTPKSNKKQ